MIRRFKELKKGTQRLMLVFNMLVFIIPHVFHNTDIDDFDGVIFIVLYSISYWIFLRMILWIIDGYKNS